MCQYGGYTLCFYFPTYYSDYLASPDAVAGNKINFWFIVYLYESVWGSGNLGIWQLGKFPASCKQTLITHILTKVWIQVCSQPNSLEKYFAKVGFGMSDTVEYDHFIFPQNFSSGDYLFFYNPGENSVVGFPTPDSEDTLEDYIPYQDVVDTMGDDMMEAMECKKIKICDDYDYIFGE